MAKSDTENGDNKRLIRKDKAMMFCHEAIAKTARNFGAFAMEYNLDVPDGQTAEKVAEAAGAVLVGTKAGSFFALASETVAVVRLSTGLLTSSLAAVNSESRRAFGVELVDVPSSTQEWRKVSVDIWNGKPDLGKVVEAAGSGQKAATMIGETVSTAGKTFSKISTAAVYFAVTLDVINQVYQMNQQLSGQRLRAEEAISRHDCSKAVSAAAKLAWSQAPNVFHENSIPTSDRARKYYARKEAR